MYQAGYGGKSYILLIKLKKYWYMMVGRIVFDLAACVAVRSSCPTLIWWCKNCNVLNKEWNQFKCLLLYYGTNSYFSLSNKIFTPNLIRAIYFIYLIIYKQHSKGLFIRSRLPSTKPDLCDGSEVQATVIFRKLLITKHMHFCL